MTKRRTSRRRCFIHMLGNALVAILSATSKSLKILNARWSAFVMSMIVVRPANWRNVFFMRSYGTRAGCTCRGEPRMRRFRAEPSRVISFAPGRTDVVVSRPGHVSRHAEPGEVLRTNDLRRAPIDRFPTRFLEAMRAKGWLRDR